MPSVRITRPCMNHLHLRLQVERSLGGWYSCAAVSAAGSLVARAYLEVPPPTPTPPPVIAARPQDTQVHQGSCNVGISVPCIIGGETRND